MLLLTFDASAECRKNEKRTWQISGKVILTDKNDLEFSKNVVFSTDKFKKIIVKNKLLKDNLVGNHRNHLNVREHISKQVLIHDFTSAKLSHKVQFNIRIIARSNKKNFFIIIFVEPLVNIDGKQKK